jgi:hypothetical protein
MSMTHFRGQYGSWLAVVAVALCLAWAGPAGAQSRRDRNDSPGDQIRRQNEVALQKIYSDVADALRDANKVGAKDPVKAVKILKRMKAKVEDDNVLTEAKRTSLLRTLDTRIRFWNSEADTQVRNEADRHEKRKLTQKGREDDDLAGRERIKGLKKSFDDTRDSINEGKSLAKRRLDAERSQKKSLIASSIPINGDVEWTKDPYLQKQLKKRTNTQKLTKKETALLKILNSTISVDFKDEKFKAVIDYLMDKTGQTIFLDEESMKEATIDYDTPVTLKAKKIGVRSLLRKILNDVGLTYVIKDEIIQVVTLKKAKEMMVTKVYPVSDLITSNIDFRLPLFLQQQQMMLNAKGLIDLIQSTIDPQSWSTKGDGGGTITFDLATMSLVVKQSAEMHYAMGGAFRR